VNVASAPKHILKWPLPALKFSDSGLDELRPPGKKSGDKRNSDTSANVARKIH